MRRADSALAQVHKTAGWNSGAMRAYLPYVADESPNIRLIRMNRSRESSVEEDVAPSMASSVASFVSSTRESIYDLVSCRWLRCSSGGVALDGDLVGVLLRWVVLSGLICLFSWPLTHLVDPAHQ